MSINRLPEQSCPVFNKLTRHEPAIQSMWSRDTGHRIPCFDRRQLIITWMSNTKEVHSKPRLHVSLSTCYLEYGRHFARRHRRRRAYALTSNTVAMITMRKSTHGFPFDSHIWVAYGDPLGGPSGRRSSAKKPEIFNNYSMSARWI